MTRSDGRHPGVARRRLVTVVAPALAAALVACSGGAKKKVAAPAAPSTTEATTTTSTTVLPTTTTTPPVSPLTGLPPADAGKLNRPALVVKIDNLDPVARPQSGLTKADICFEEQVEGGITRFACVWQSNDADLVGPIRSTRTTDIAIVSSLNHPLYAFSGGNTDFLAAIRRAPIVDLGADTSPAAYFRYGNKPAPHNLYSRVTTLYGLVPGKVGPPPSQFVYRAAGEAVTSSGAAAATHADIKFPDVGGPAVTWDWDASSQTWKRGQNGSADVTPDGGQISAANVIFQFVKYTIVGYQTIGGVTGPIPMANLVGEGQALILTGGETIAATWSKPTATSVTQFADAGGAPVKLTPGQTWVELAPLGTPVNSK
ncbi:MAG TPA: DUF3048 domain-containing protein [Acidimicrobiales bacterium]|nr:DUF3048 domain-containing protein [Acidimicrobiales bacterium]